MYRNSFVLQRVMSTKSKKNRVPPPTTNPTINDDPINIDKEGNIRIRILAKPQAKHNAITDISVDGIGIQISAPPSEGEANTELVKYLSKVLNIRKSDIYLDKGLRSRSKIAVVNKNITTPELVRNLINKEMNL